MRPSKIKIVVLALVLAVLVRAGYEMVRASTGGRPDFTATDLSGKPWRLSDHRGKGPLLVNFFGLT
jgi:hypothetical protein